MVFKIFNLDLHISVIQDVKNILNHLFGPCVQVTNWSISGHNWVFNAPTPAVEIIDQRNWRIIDAAMISAFQTKYDEYLRTFDAFIVTHTPVFCAIYEKYNKPVILVNSCRYEQPYCWNGNMDGWRWLNDVLHRMYARGQLVAISNNRADRDYLRIGTGIESIHIPSLCLYTRATYNPTRPTFICHGARDFFPPHKLLEAQLPSGYSWSDLYSYRGIVHIPYEMSTMSLFEQYSAGVPLWLPSRAFYETCIRDGRMTCRSAYARKSLPELDAVLSDLGFWLDRADFYDAENFKYVRFYSSAADLLRQLETFDESDDERRTRCDWIAARKSAVYNSWHEVFSRCDALAKIWR
jgi:hypothetical protein